MFDVNKLRVASPCPVSWEQMKGDDRVRHCHSCQLNIYNTAEMTGNEIEDLILRREGRVCIRLHKRIDGTVITKDCPVGLRAFRKRTACFAGATLTAILGLFSISFGQKHDKKPAETFRPGITRTIDPAFPATLIGTVTDSNGAIISNADIRLTKKGVRKPIKTKTDKDGNYSISPILPGIYELRVKSQGFITSLLTNVEVKENERLTFNISLQPGSISITVGIFTEEPMIDTSSSSVTTKITRDKIERIPH